MAYIKKDIKKFDKEIIGSFGDFETSSSYDLHYLMSTLNIKDINDLNSASDVLKLKDTNFEELVQRDIDYKRVDEQIVKQYLEKGKDKVIFFPPLLISPMIVKEGKPIDKFKNKDIETKDNEIFINWDNILELSFPLNNNDQVDYPYKITDEKGDKKSIYNYATTIKYNSNNIKLVVIDGQHRFMALKRIWEDQEKKDILKNIKIPICIFFTPNAIEGNNNESLTRSMRQLFVVINSTAKQVSGHFITLLNDESLTSYAIRDFADFLKENNNLFFLEWNEREDKRASQINKKYSITTVKILNDTLKEFLFKEVLTQQVLQLNQHNLHKECDKDINILEISDSNFELCSIEVLKRQMRTTTTEFLNILFFQPKPYLDKKEQFYKALKELNQKVKNNITGAEYFRDSVLFQFRGTSNFDTTVSKDIEQEFLSHFYTQPECHFYFKNVFQQAYIRALLKLYSQIIEIEKIDIVKLAKFYIKSIEKICFDDRKQLFSHSREYTQNVFYKNARILVNDKAKTQIENLILSIFLNKSSISIFEKEINNQIITNSIKELAKKSSFEYFDNFKTNNITNMKKNWRNILDTDDALYNILNELEKLSKNNKDDKKKFEDKIKDIIEKKYIKAKTVFFNILEVNENNHF